MSAALEHARVYAGYGWPVFPCHSIRRNGNCTCSDKSCDKQGKHPRICEWPERASIDDHQIRQWWKRWPAANPAILTGDGLVVIDVDPRNGGDESLAMLEEELGQLPRQYAVETGGGGLHIYLSVPKTVKIQSRNSFRPGIDVKAEGGYVIAPPARHACGGQYKWQQPLPPEDVSLPPAPPKWQEALPTPAASTRVASAEATPAQHGEPLSHWFRRPLDTQYTDKSQINTDTLLRPYLCSEWDSEVARQVERAIELSTVSCPGTRNHQLVQLAKRLQRLPELRAYDAEDLEPVVREWHRRSLPSMRTKDWEISWKEWVAIWVWIDPNKNEDDAALLALDISKGREPPQFAQAYKSKNLRRLITWCGVLQEKSDDGVFYLSCRKAAEGLGITYRQANSQLNKLVRDGILEKTDEHKPGSMRAQRYRYLGGDQIHGAVRVAKSVPTQAVQDWAIAS